MSKTIIERAVRLGCIVKEKSSLQKDACNDEFREFWDNVSLSQPNGVSFHGIPEYVSEVCCQAYIAGATEQRKIDIDNACEAYCNVVCQAEQTSGKRCYWIVQNERCPELESFVKSMEDKK